jgi:hypothetical protein
MAKDYVLRIPDKLWQSVLHYSATYTSVPPQQIARILIEKGLNDPLFESAPKSTASGRPKKKKNITIPIPKKKVYIKDYVNGTYEYKWIYEGTKEYDNFFIVQKLVAQKFDQQPENVSWVTFDENKRPDEEKLKRCADLVDHMQRKYNDLITKEHNSNLRRKALE